MKEKCITLFLVVAFLNFVVTTEFASAGASGDRADAAIDSCRAIVSDGENEAVATGPGPLLDEESGIEYDKKAFDVRESLRLAEVADDVQDMFTDGSKPEPAPVQKSPAKNTEKGEGLSKGTIAAIIIGVICLAVLAIAATKAAHSGPDLSGLKLNFGY